MADTPNSKDTQKAAPKRDPRILILAAFIVVVIGGGIAALAYMGVSNRTVYIDRSQISAPLSDLAPATAGVLKAVYVSEGQVIPPNTVVAQVGTQLLKSTGGGLVVTVNNNIGKLVSPTAAVVTTLDPAQLRVIGQVQEDKGLIHIKVGDPVTFTVDAFGGKQFTGVVDSVAPTAQSGDVVFSVSDNRQEQDFDVKVNYDPQLHPEIKNGMSAKMWVYKQQ
jgi:multidrug resistance efflux pump